MMLGQNSFDFESAGTKARFLHQLHCKNFNVPPGFVLPPDAEATLSELLPSILENIKTLGGFPVAVRSSSNLEDLAQSSFAGLYDSFLNVADEASLKQAILDCYRARKSERLLAYCHKFGIAHHAVRVSILLQKMISGKTSGVLFTLNPINGKEEEMLIEACLGLGERLVSGRVNPSHYVVDLESGKTIRTTLSPTEGDLLTTENLGELSRVAGQIQSTIGQPQDIEWTFDSNGKLWILQSRPITKIHWREDVDQLTNANFKDGGVSARVCTPFLYSIYERVMQKSLPEYLERLHLLSPNRKNKEQWIYPFYGRVYWNVGASKKSLFRVPGFDEQAFDADLGMQTLYGPQGPQKTPVNYKTIIPVLPVAVFSQIEVRRILKVSDHYEKFFKSKEQQLHQALNVDAKATFAEVIHFQNQTEIDYFSMVYNNSTYQNSFKALIQQIEEKFGQRFSFVRLVSGLSDIDHSGVQSDLLELVDSNYTLTSPEYLRMRKEFLKEHGFHADAELDILCPRWEEFPERIDEIVSQLRQKEKSLLHNPEKTVMHQHEEYEKEKTRVELALRQGGVRSLLLSQRFRTGLEKARHFMQKKERMREFSVRAYHLLRKGMVQLEKEEPDLFFCTVNEIEAYLAGKSLPEDEVIQQRKQHYEGYRNFIPPDEFGKSVGSTRDSSAPIVAIHSGVKLTGLGCSPGLVEGTVRILENLNAAYSIEAKEILVTRFTDPGWTPILGIAAGAITEVGGLLSHAAVIGREFGIPTILNLANATKLLKNGQRIRMNGETGEVFVLSD